MGLPTPPLIRVFSGLDLVEISRFRRVLARHEAGLRRRVFTPREWDLCQGRPACLALRFAAKEAASKALGTGIGPVSWRDMEILADERGAPMLLLHGKALDRAKALGWRTWTVSLTDTDHYAAAMVVALAW